MEQVQREAGGVHVFGPHAQGGQGHTNIYQLIELSVLVFLHVDDSVCCPHEGVGHGSTDFPGASDLTIEVFSGVGDDGDVGDNNVFVHDKLLI